MKLTLKSETSSRITFGYDKPAGDVDGYLYFADGKQVARTLDPNDLDVTFGKVSSGKYSVEAFSLATVDRAEWPTGTTQPPTQPPPTQPPPTGTISPTQFASMATAGATIENVTVTGGVEIKAANVTMKNVVFQGVVRFRAGAKGSKITGGGGLGFDILSADDITIENCVWNGQHRRDQNFIWDDPAGDFPSNITIRGCTFQGYCCAGAHEEALYVGSSVGGLIENCTFTDNATQAGTGHIFFTYCGQKSGNHNGCASNDLGTEAKNWCVRGCKFGPGPMYYSIQVHEFVPASANIKIDPSQETVKALIGPTQQQASMFGKPC